MHVTIGSSVKERELVAGVFTQRALSQISPSVTCILVFVLFPGFFLCVCIGNTFTVLFAHFLQIIILLHVFSNGT
jgi:hypothetical protein